MPLIDINNLTLPEMLLIAAAVGGGLKGAGMAAKFLFFSGKEKENISANAKKTTADARRIEQDKEIALANYLQGVFNNIQELQTKHNGELKIKDSEIAKLLKQNIDLVAFCEEKEFVGNGLDKAIQRLMAKLDTPYWETDANGNGLFVNGAWLELLGVRLNELASWIDAVVPSDREMLLGEWERRVIDLDADTPISFRIVNKITNEIINVQSIYSIVHNRKGEVVKIIGVTIPV